MSNSILSNVSLAQLRQAVHLKESIAALQAELASLLGGFAASAAPVVSAPAALNVSAAAASVPEAKVERRGGRRVVSDEARARMALSQRARWAKYHEATGTKGRTPAAAPEPSEAPEVPAQAGGMSAQGRERIAAAQRARWAKYYESKGTVPRRLLPKKNGLSPAGRARLIAAQKARWARFHAQKGI